MSQDDLDQSDDDPYAGLPRCPYCLSEDDCEHLLLLVDITFRTAEGGILMDRFNARWHELCEAGGDSFDEYEPFNTLLEDVDRLAERQIEYDFEGGPGMSSSYVGYYIKTLEKSKEALSKFSD